MKSDSNHRSAVMELGDLRVAWLETFVCVAKLRNRSAVARELGISQGAVTKHVQSLERWMRAILVDHDSVPATLTDDGEAFVEPAELILDVLREAQRPMSDVVVRGPRRPRSIKGRKVLPVTPEALASSIHINVPPKD